LYALPQLGTMTRMTAQRYGQCTVCGRQLSERQEYGGRPYCSIHLAMFPQDLPFVWQASTLTFGTILLLVVGLAIASRIALVTNFIIRTPVVGVALALAPGLTWLALLYRAAARRQITLSPLLPTLLILAALVAAGIGRPLLLGFLNLDLWLSQTSPSNRFLGNVLLYGFEYAFTLYALIRYTVWRTPIFTHRIDGVLYGLAASWGYGSIFLLISVLEQGGITPLNGGLRILNRLGAYLAPGLVIGYFLGRNRFEDMPIYYLSAGLSMAGVLNGIMLYAGTELNNIRLGIDQDGFSPWPGLVFSMLVLAATYASVYGLTRRHNALTRARIGLQS